MRYFILLVLSVNAIFAKDETELREFINANNVFAASLYKQIAQIKEESFLISPYSAELVLAFLESGCRGETAEEIRNTLHLPHDRDKIESIVKESISTLKGNDGYKLLTANKMYVQENFPIKEKFNRVATEVFQADIENINFARQEIAAKTMNDWVEKQTNNKIKNLISPDVLVGVMTVLINAVYFQGNWSRSFDQHSTRNKAFYKSKGEVVQVDTMHAYRRWYNYCENTEVDAKFLEISFEGEEVAMVIALPNQRSGLVALENQIEKVFASQKFEEEYLNVQLPKFKIESTLPLVKTIQKLGIKKPFDSTQADLSGIAGQKGDLVVSDALQKTYINVEEGGVEAAAATYIDAVIKSTIFRGPKELIINHPFVFYLKAKNFIIFAGRFAGPV